MSDNTVDFFLENLKQLTTSSNLNFTIDEKHQLHSIKEEIKYLREFIMTTQKKRNEHLEVMKLVMLIRDVVSEAKNIVDMFVIQADQACLSFFRSRDQACLSLHLESVEKDIKTLRAEVNRISENMYDNGVAVKKLKNSSTESGAPQKTKKRKTSSRIYRLRPKKAPQKTKKRKTSSFSWIVSRIYRLRPRKVGTNTSEVIEEKVVVGLKEEVETLLKKLCDSGEGKELEIISIVGVGGGGKTTLAREVYEHRLTVHTFDIRAWVHVSQDYDNTMKRDLLISIILEFASLRKDEAEASEHELGEKLLKRLKGSKYLIVMDDIWGIEAWNDIQRSFPKERKGSKVLFTSRQLIQPDGVCCVPHKLDPLPKSCSWELLQKKVFGRKPCPLKLVGIGEQIAGKCEGLPLGIVATAGILVTVDETIDAWKEVAKHLSSIIATKQKRCMEILELSYNHLPLHLKVCFLYIGAYPKDYKIPIRELIWLWIAEGFIQQSERGKSLEDVAEDYLSGLVDRSLIMVDKKSESHGGIKACRIHDLLRELCLKKAKEYDFLVQIYRDDSFSPCATNKHRRLFIGSQFFHKFSSRLCAPNLRSFVCLSLPNSSHSWLEQNLSFFVENFELLRVLHLISVTSQGEIRMRDLVHLRYIALTLPTGKPYDCGPTSFHYLWYVETLNLQVSSYRDNISLPCDIVKMVKLRHLYTKLGIFEYHYDEDEGNKLDSLQTLHRMCICKDCLRFLKRTPNLRKLGLDGDNVMMLPDLDGDNVLMLPDLEFLKYLEILNIVVSQFDNELVASTGLKLPPTLTRLTLRYTSLKWQELSIILQTLPRLEVLKLFTHACVGPVWDTSELEKGFSQLKYLMLEELDLEEWNASEQQFPRLEVLVIQMCRKLERIPIEFADLYDLHEIKLEWSSHSAEESAREIQEKQINTRGDDACLKLITTLNDA